MNVKDKIVVVTGGGHGIGKALCEAFHREGARRVIVADLDGEAGGGVAKSVGGVGHRCDVGKEADIVALIEATEKDVGPIDLFCSNAGVGGVRKPTPEAATPPDADWMWGWQINVMAHVHAARALVPRMIKRGGGHFLNTVSAAGLLSQIGNSVYATTKHAAIGFAESLAISHRDEGIRVSVLCPQAVDKNMLRAGGRGPQHIDGVLSPEQVADATIEALGRDDFLVLPHPQVLKYMQAKTADYNRWIGGMAKLRRSLNEAGQ